MLARSTRRAAPLAVAVLSIIAGTTCEPLTAPRPEPVTLAYDGADRLIAGAVAAPPVEARRGGAALERPVIRFRSSDTAVVGVTVGGDSLVARRLGTATVTAVLHGSLLPEPLPTVDFVLRVAPKSLTTSRGTLALASLDETAALTATATDVRDQPIEGVAPRWESAAPAVATVDAATGVVTARGNGTTVIRAIVGIDTAVSSVTVQQQVASIVAAPGDVLLDALGADSALAVAGLDATGHPAALGTAVPLVWTSADTTIATVDGAGRVRSKDNGGVWVRVARGALRDSVRVTVNQAAVRVRIGVAAAGPTLAEPTFEIHSLTGTLPLTARGEDRLNQIVRDDAPAWTTLDPDSAQVDTRTGIVTGIGVGIGRIVARMDGATDTADVRVTDDPVTLEATPGAATMTSVGDTILLRVTGRNALGRVVAGPVRLEWGTPDSAVVKSVGDGRVVALAPGLAQVTATAGAAADTVAVTVQNVPTTVDITPATAALTSLGDTVLPPVDLRNQRGAALARESVLWASEDPTVARVTGSGAVIARAEGTVWVYATSPFNAARRDSVQVTVSNLPAAIALSATVDTLTAIGQTLAYAAEVRNGRGALIPGAAVAWRSSNTGAASVSGGGVATAAGFGAATVTATAGDVSASASLVVREPSVWYVDNASPSPQKIGTLARPFAKIQEAVDAASAGDTVVVFAGASPYRESLRLSKSVTLLGDSAAYVAAGRDASKLPLVSHDTGAAGITAITTAPIRVRYLAMRHNIDGPALHVENTAPVVTDFHVNPGATFATTRIGRGVLIRNAPPGTLLSGSSVAAVRGYGVRLEDVTQARVSRVAVTGVDSVPGTLGSGIELVRGSRNRVESNTIRAAGGAQILVDTSVTSIIVSNDLAGRHQLMRVRGVREAVNNNIYTRVDSNSFDARLRPEDDGLGSEDDNRTALELFDSFGVKLTANSFRDGSGAAAAMTFINLHKSAAVLFFSPSFRGGFANIASDSSRWGIEDVTSDSALVVIRSIGADTFAVSRGTMRNAESCVFADGPRLLVVVDRTRFDNCTRSSTAASARAAVSITDNSRLADPAAAISGAVFANNRGPALRFAGRYLEVGNSTIDETSAEAAPSVQSLPALEIAADSAAIFDNTIGGWATGILSTALAGVSRPGSFLRISGNRISENGVGIDAAGMDTLDVWNNIIEKSVGAGIAADQVELARFAGDSIIDNARDDQADGAGIQLGAFVDSAWVSGEFVARQSNGPGIRGQGRALAVEWSMLTRNQLGIAFTGGDVAGHDNAIFDNLGPGLTTNGTGAGVLFADDWWGDALGPSGLAEPLSVGDSVNVPDPAALEPFRDFLYLWEKGTTPDQPRIVGGEQQTAGAGTALPAPLAVRVVDALGLPVEGVDVTFTVTEGDGSLAGGLETLTVTTDDGGLARATLTLGAEAGRNRVRASAAGKSVTFTATGS